MNPPAAVARLATRVTRPDLILIAIACVAITALAATTLLDASRTIVLATASILWLGLLVDALVRHPPAPD